MSMLARRNRIARDTLDSFNARRLMKQGGILGTDAEVTAAITMGRRGWVNDQIAKPMTSPWWRHNRTGYPQSEYERLKQSATPTVVGTRVDAGNMHGEPIWWSAMKEPDVLRTRMAWALKQIFVYGANEGTEHDIYGTWMKVIQNNALGNFYNLMRDVTYSWNMSEYLTYRRNEKEAGSGPTDRQPDENYAREILQLFTIGLWELHPNGVRKKYRELKTTDERYRPPGSAGADDEVPTYETLTHIRDMAKIFTGFDVDYRDVRNADGTVFLSRPSAFTSSTWQSFVDPRASVYAPDGAKLPLVVYPQFHSTGAKNILPNVYLPALTLQSVIANSTSQTEINKAAANAAICAAEVETALRAIFNHDNVGPFIGRSLIRFMTKSNPSPDYVARVAAAFNDDGTGVRGNLAAVAKAILLDQEVLFFDDSVTAGKVQEPIIEALHKLRAVGTPPNTSSRLTIDGGAVGAYSWWPTSPFNEKLGQWPFQSPSVFNFFLPNYKQPGDLLDSNLDSPELQIHTESTYTRILNAWFGFQSGPLVSTNAPGFVLSEAARAASASAGGTTAQQNEAARAALLDYLIAKHAIKLSSSARTAILASLATVQTTLPTSPDSTTMQRFYLAIASTPEWRVLR